WKGERALSHRNFRGLPTGKLSGTGGAVTPAMVGPPTMAGSKWQSRPMVVSRHQASAWLPGKLTINRPLNYNRTASPTIRSGRNGTLASLLSIRASARLVEQSEGVGSQRR